MKPVIIIAIAFVLLIPLPVFAETEHFTVAARDYERRYISLTQGDEIEYTVTVSGGENDDIEFTIYYPSGKDDGGGMIYDRYDGGFTAQTTGTYIFEFDTPSIFTNKSVKFSYEITKNTYYVYVADIPKFAEKYAGMVVGDAAKYWKEVFPKKNFYVADSESQSDIMIQWVRDFTGMKHVGFQYVRLIEVGLGDSNCLGQWNPYSSKHVTAIMTHEIGHAIGLGHSDNPDSIMYPTISPTTYGVIEIDSQIGPGQIWFIPFCGGNEPKTVNYSVKSSDPNHGFDVYVVPQREDFENIGKGEPFVYFNSKKCFGEGFLSYFGTCSGPLKESGLVIINDENLKNSISTIEVSYYELDYDQNPAPLATKLYTKIHETANFEMKIFGDRYDFSSNFYQNKDNLIKFQDGNGDVIHRYGDVDLSYLFDTLGMKLTNDCVTIIDNREFCNNDDYFLNFNVNGKKLRSLTNYIFKDGDNIKIEFESKNVSLKPTIQETQIPNTLSKTICGKGTVEKNGQCVLEAKPISETKSSKGGGCLIATATYGSELAPQVQQLRELRDNSLLSTQSGTNFMNLFNYFYYSFSPAVADLERESPVFREAVKIAITPMISSLSILNYVDMDSEIEVLGYGISLIILNGMMYVGIPATIILKIRK